MHESNVTQDPAGRWAGVFKNRIDCKIDLPVKRFLNLPAMLLM